MNGITKIVLWVCLKILPFSAYFFFFGREIPQFFFHHLCLWACLFLLVKLGDESCLLCLWRCFYFIFIPCLWVIVNMMFLCNWIKNSFNSFRKALAFIRTFVAKQTFHWNICHLILFCVHKCVRLPNKIQFNSHKFQFNSRMKK
jgi:hypothetical protein